MRISDWSSDVCSSDLGGRLVGTALGPVEQRLIGWRDAVPDLLNRLHIQPERLRQRGLGKPRRNADPQSAGRQLQQREPAVRLKPVQQFGHDEGRLLPGKRLQAYDDHGKCGVFGRCGRYFGLRPDKRSEEHTSELQSLMRISYAVFCLKKKTTTKR